VSVRDEGKNPFMVQFVVMEILSETGGAADDEEDPFADA